MLQFPASYLDSPISKIRRKVSMKEIEFLCTSVDLTSQNRYVFSFLSYLASRPKCRVPCTKSVAKVSVF